MLKLRPERKARLSTTKAEENEKQKTICKTCQILDEEVAQLKKRLPGEQKHWAWNPEHSLKAKHGKFLLTPVLGRGWSRALLISQSCCIFGLQFLLRNSQSHEVNNPQRMKNNQNEILKCEIRRKQMKTEKGGLPIKIRFSLAFKPFAGWGDSTAV